MTPGLPADWTEVAKAAARNHKLLEVNNTSLNPLAPEKVQRTIIKNF